MAIPVFIAGLVGSLLIAMGLPVFANQVALAWLFACSGFALFYSLDRIVGLLDRQDLHVLWYERIEAYRFAKQHPEAPAEWNAQEVARQQAVVEQENAGVEFTRKQLAKVATERQASKEAKQKANEPAFVARELVPEVPADFKPPKAKVDFSALDDAAKPRRKRD